MWEYIEATRDQVCDLERRVRLVKGNVHTITSIMAKWSEAPLYQRREDKKDCLLNLEVGGHVQSDLNGTQWERICFDTCCYFRASPELVA